MSRSLSLLCGFIILLGGVLLATPGMALADQEEEGERKCFEKVDLNLVRVQCEHSAESIKAARASDPGSVWRFFQLCKEGTSGGAEACANPRVCEVDGKVGTLYSVYKDGQRDGIACLTAGELATLEVSTRALVIAMFKDLDWSDSDLVVQPPGGKTLVNLESNFYTANTEPQTINVTLDGQTVAVTAVPIGYEWHFGDGSSTTTESAGAPYPDLDVTHVYTEVDEHVVSVDTQYGAASFTVNGGPPEQIPSTVWVPGEEQDLEVVEALPQLVNR